MLSNKPYLLRAIHQWILDNQWTPYLLVQAEFPDVVVPNNYADQDGKIILSLSPAAIRNLDIQQESIQFKASFSGAVFDIYVPVPAVLAIYASENGEGMMFEEEDPKAYLKEKKKKQEKQGGDQVSYLRIVED